MNIGDDRKQITGQRSIHWFCEYPTQLMTRDPGVLEEGLKPLVSMEICSANATPDDTKDGLTVQWNRIWSCPWYETARF